MGTRRRGKTLAEHAQHGRKAIPAPWTPRLLAAARSAARQVTASRQIVADALEATEASWIAAALRSTPPDEPEAWVRRVARNHTLRLLRDVRRRPRAAIDGDEATAAADPSDHLQSAMGILDLKAVLVGLRPGTLTRTQWQVLQALTEPGTSLHAAAARLGMDRTNLRRTFHRALARLRAARGLPPGAR